MTFDVKPNLRVSQDRKASGGIQLSRDLGNDVTLKVRDKGSSDVYVRLDRDETPC